MARTDPETGAESARARTALAIGNTAIDEFYRDETLETSRPGGTAYNVASWFRYHGLRASLCSTLGTDFPDQPGIDTSFCEGAGTECPRCEVTLNDSNVPEDRRWVEGEFCFRTLGPVERRFDVVLLTAGRSEYETPFRTAAASIKGFALDPLVEDYDAEQLRTYLLEADYLFLNREERRALEGKLDVRIASLIEEYRLLGAVETSAERVLLHEPGESVTALEFETLENPIDTTGAGDAFASTFLAARVAGVPTERALQSAHETARRAIETLGAHPFVDRWQGERT